MNNKYLIVFLTFLFFITVGFIIYLNSSSDIPVVYGSSDPIRELPSNAPQMDRPPNIPCIYSLWKNTNESCGTSENVFEEKHIIHMIKNIRQNYPPSLWNTIYQLTKQGHISDYLNDQLGDVIEKVVNESSQDTSV